MENLVLRPAMLPVLLYQRTQYAWPCHKVARRYLGRVKLYGLYWRFIAPNIERSRARAISAMYQDEINREFDEIKDHLPSRGCTILDIGCGLAGIDLRLYKHFEGDVAMHLLDKEGVSEIYYGFKEEAAHYNNCELTRRFLSDNGVSEKDLTFHDAQKNEFPVGVQFDLIISLISWAFHYPISVYLDRVAAALRPGGKVIVDIRKNTDGLQTLQSKFGEVRVLSEDRKRVRVAATKL